ncbi:MAG: (2Fe-2S)-binding protein [Gammaproteobacteria bacterium]|nr:(2Fe-2S)-binding protein [Gammaproteobacteria bacterium]MBT3860136.1 (2Fe-2S)-binding protein [Gammaproteobacteria bacterium]MBT3987428.1 (2Fe-2S)-binding protein [Gammaproteobacteria bacterium]MBT4255151.1 (2Fe-2S)-binding protein [Gammaproteobacteria bacterium]MBT4581834.1 (2Fe-2S)-binding protein [Gammaproteobacteria bacterium]
MNPKTTRRRFIKGVIASGAAATTSTIWFAANGQDKPAGAVERMIRINVNGQVRTVDVAPQETLASTLRYKLGLTGTKLGCNRGECGACTVLVDDVPSYACSVLTHSVKNQVVETVEGLESANGTLHPVQQAFVEELSPQCGYCTPGQVMSAVGLLRSNPNPTREEARQGMAGNICRCGSYDSYLNGVMRAADIG